MGSANFLPAYKTSKARVCVTVGMMTMGDDWYRYRNSGRFDDLLATDLSQIKGAHPSTTSWNSSLNDRSEIGVLTQKSAFKLFDFFATCEYFEEKFNDDEASKQPQPERQGRRRRPGSRVGGPTSTSGRDHRIDP